MLGEKTDGQLRPSVTCRSKPARSGHERGHERARRVALNDVRELMLIHSSHPRLLQSLAFCFLIRYVVLFVTGTYALFI